MSWLLADYHPVSLFSLRPATATASGGKTLLTPTAFALKMALLNSVIQTAGVAEGERRFPIIRDLRIMLSLPAQITVLKSFAKIQRPARLKVSKEKDETAEALQSRQQQEVAELMEMGHYPFRPTIAYRELVQFGAPLGSVQNNALRIALSSPNGTVSEWLPQVALAINYLGRRGGFMQPLGLPRTVETLSGDFTEVTADSAAFTIDGTLQMLDDCGPTMTFAHADIYNAKRITLGKERILRHVVLPHRLTRSSRGYSLYERRDQ